MAIVREGGWENYPRQQLGTTLSGKIAIIFPYGNFEPTARLGGALAARFPWARLLTVPDFGYRLELEPGRRLPWEGAAMGLTRAEEVVV